MKTRVGINPAMAGQPHEFHADGCLQILQIGLLCSAEIRLDLFDLAAWMFDAGTISDKHWYSLVFNTG